MKYQNLLQVAFIGALLATAIGCNKNQDTLDSKITAAPITPAATTLPTASTTRTINDHQYQFAGNKVSELTTDADDQATYGVISDAHGEVEKYYGETSAPLKKFSTFQYVEGEKGKRVKVKQQQNEKN